MSSLVNRLVRAGWMAVPLSAYLLIAIVLPAANGAASRSDFVHHSLWVAAGCVGALVVVMLGGAIGDVMTQATANGTRTPRVGRKP